ncbi:peptidase inhibitor 16 isoform X1 [Meleagris gallopavo]|uniref:Peptidase inhibitor 16 n=1 Tax=Meleagris gallopavo TaxID=9103 RepID=G1MUG4_MELGA|nr:peptidase inhibitor 16 isoform X1 [Meleagris gallopavo]XP_019478807.1 peptidase inhibitor 16 isoform X1 [Meleagris gallopavo]
MFPPRSSSCWVFLAFGRCFKSDCQSCGLLRAEAVCTMLSSGLSPLFLLLTALELSWSLTDEEKRIILDEHNKYRSQVSPPAVDMLKMSWDTELEAFAQAYAEKCIWDHNKERGRRGENLFAMAPMLDLEFAVEDWNAEEKFYNLTTSTCVSGQMCGHYTQVVWASTHRIGCGSKFCEKIEGIETEDMYLLVCNYYPPGNMKGRKPYREGPSCSQCPEDRVCVNSLCEPTIEETTPPSVTTKASPSTPVTPERTTPAPTTVPAKPEPTTMPSATTPVASTAKAKPKPATTKPSYTTPVLITATSKPKPTVLTTTTAAKPAPTTPESTTTTPEPTTTMPKPTTTTITTTTTAKPVPTTPKPTTTTPEPTTTTPKPTTTTTTKSAFTMPKHTTTTAAKPQPTTPKPTTTTLAKPVPTTPKPTTSTTAKPEPTTTMPEPTTTTTTKPAPTTTKPVMTTPKPTTTTTTKPTPTTPKSTTTTTAKPTPTTPKPTTTSKTMPTPTTPKITTTTKPTPTTPKITTTTKPTPTTPKITTTTKPTPTTPKTTTTTKPTPTTPKPTTTTTIKPTPTVPKLTATTTAKPKPATAKPTSTTPTFTTTTAKPTSTAITSAKPESTTTTKTEHTKTESPDYIATTGLTLSFEPTLDSDYRVFPEAESDTEEPVASLTTENPDLLESMGTAISPKSVPETNNGVKEDEKEKSAFSSSPTPSPSQIIPEIKLGFNKAELITSSKSVVSSPEEPIFMRLTSSSKEKGQSPAFQTSLSADALSAEELETNSDHEGKQQPTAGAPSTHRGLLLFLLPNVILVGLLL